MTKIMTSIIAFDLIKRGELSLDENLLYLKNLKIITSRIFINVYNGLNINFSIKSLRGIIFSSGNDAFIALAEGIAGSEEEFAIMMTSKAQELGMTNTNFANSSGLNSPKNFQQLKIF